MGFFENYRINKAISRLLAAPTGTSSAAVEAAAALKRFNKTTVILKLIEALGKAQQPRVLSTVLEGYVQNATLSLLGEGLASANPRVVTAVVDVLAQAQGYDPNRLLECWTDPRIPKATLGKLLAAHHARLDVTPVLRCLDNARAEDRALLLGVLVQVATAEHVPVLAGRLTTKDDAFRLTLARLIARLGTEEGRVACLGLLNDPHAPIRQAALEGLGRVEFPLEVEAICRQLRDDDRSVRRQTATLLAQRKDPQTVRYLLPLCQASEDEVRQSALSLLQSIGTAEAMQTAVASAPAPAQVLEVLLGLLTDPNARIRNLALVGLAHCQEPFDIEPLCRLLADPDATVRRQAATLLTRQNDPRLFPFVLAALQDEAADIQANAVAILNALATPTLLQSLLSDLQSKEWWMVSRVTEALGKHGSAKVIEAAFPLVTHSEGFLRRCAVAILKVTQAEQVVHSLVGALEHDNSWVQTCAAEALAALGDKRAVPALLRLVDTAAPAERAIALRTLATLGASQAIPVCIVQAQSGPADVQEEALKALGTLTNADHAEAVLKAVMEVRETATISGIKTLANSTASALIRRFPDKAVGYSQAMDSAKLSRLATPSLLQEAQGRTTPPPPPDAPEEVMQASAPVPLEGMLDVNAMEPGLILSERYKVVRHIGQGGFGTVMLVDDLMVREQLILKFLHPHMASDERMIARFVHELRYARRVTHENVIRIHDFLKIERAYAISMEYFPSQSLSDELAPQRPLSLARGLWIVWYVCRGMHAAHQAQILHRDLKPPNILINDKGLVKIVDFGLAAADNDAATRLTKTGALMGTPLYMAPELLQNHQLDARMDIYSLGVIMYEVFTGVPPYQGENPMAILFKHVAGKAEPPRTLNAEIPPALETVILKAMAADPAQRYQSMDALAKDLAPLMRQYRRA